MQKQIKNLQDSYKKADDESHKFQDKFKNLSTKLESEHNKITEKLYSDLKNTKDLLNEKNLQLEALIKFKNEREIMIQDIENLRKELENEKNAHKNDVKSLEKQMFDSSEKLRREMQTKISDAKAQLMAVNDEQLGVTTRLTILQNHQLNTELEFQSKQSEKVLHENSELLHQISELKRELELSKNLTTEITKKCQYYQKINTKLQVDSEKIQQISQTKNETQLISFLEEKLIEQEKKYEKFGSEFKEMQQNYLKIQEDYSKTKNKFDKAAFILSDYLDHLLKTPLDLSDLSNIFIDVEKLKITPLENWEEEEKIAIILVLLKQLQPYLSDFTLTTESHKENLKKLLLSVNVNTELPSPVKLHDFSMNRSSSLPSIFFCDLI